MSNLKLNRYQTRALTFKRWRDHGLGAGSVTPQIQLSAASLPENSAEGTGVGALSVTNGTGTYTFSLTDTAGNRFKVAGTNGVNLQAGATSSDYEAAQSYNITVSATNGVDAPIIRVISIAITNVVEDTTPNSFTFTDVTGATTSTVYESNAITVSGIDGPANVSITGGDYSKNGVAYTSSATTAVAGDTFKVRATSSASSSTAVNVALTIGGVSDTYTVTTAGGGSGSFDFDFANNSFTPGPIASELTDARASAQYVTDVSGVLTSIPALTLAYSNAGLLVEPSATNINLRSQDLSATWTASAGSFTQNAAVAPDGTTTADLYNEDGTTSANHSVAINMTPAASTRYIVSRYVKYAGRRWIRLFANSATTSDACAWFDIQNGVAGSSSVSLGTLNGYGIEPVANGFYRIFIDLTTVAATASTPFVLRSVSADGSTASVLGLNGPAFYIWQGDVVAASGISSPILTTTAAATRAANAITVTQIGIARIEFTFDDNSTQTVTGINTGSQYQIPTNLNRRLIKRMIGYPT